MYCFCIHLIAGISIIIGIIMCLSVIGIVPGISFIVFGLLYESIAITYKQLKKLIELNEKQCEKQLEIDKHLCKIGQYICDTLYDIRNDLAKSLER